MNPSGTSATIFRTGAVLFLAVVISPVPSCPQASEKKEDRKTTRSSSGDSGKRSTAPADRARTQAPETKSTPPAHRQVEQPAQQPAQERTRRPGGGEVGTQHPGAGQSGTQHPAGGGGITDRGGAAGRGGITGSGGPPPAGGGGITSHGGAAGMGGSRNAGTASGRAGGTIYHPGANVQTTRHSDGSQTHVDSRTRTTVHTDQGGRVTVLERPGLRASNFREGGRPAHIEHTRTDGSRMVVDRGFRGERRVEAVRPGGVRVVAVGRQAFVERPFRAGYVSRTYIVGGRTEVFVYRSYTYHSFRYVAWVPPVYYQPGFYGWAVRPWGPRVVYGWGWGPATPWFYGGYFAPEPYYPTPALWLTDFLLAADLQLAYENQQQRYQDQQQQLPPQTVEGNGVALTPEIKLQIAEEVRQQLAAEQAAAAQPTSAPLPQGAAADVPPPALRQRVFVVSTSLDVTAIGGGQSCSLSAGDIIERTPGQPITSDGVVAVNVMSSKAGDCPADFATQIDLATLQDMQNQFREQIASGMESLANNQGRGGLPPGPAANPRRSAEGQAPPNATNDAEARDLITKLNQEADQTEADARLAPSGVR